MIGNRIRRPTRRKTYRQPATGMLRASLLLAVLVGLVLPFQASGSPQARLRGSDVGHFTLTQDGCGVGVFRVDISGAGKATLLGRYRYRATECFGGTAYSGAFTMRAANGDALIGIYNGTVGPTNDPNVATYDQEAAVTGGTGRFLDARGSFHVSGVANLATGEYKQRLSGDVSAATTPDRK